MKFIFHILKFILLLGAMWLVASFVPFGPIINSIITLIALWSLVG